MKYAIIILLLLAGTTTADTSKTKVVIMGDSILNNIPQYLTPLTSHTIINASHGGYKTTDGITILDTEILTQCPDALVLVGYGINDMYVDVGNTTSRIPPQQFHDNLFGIFQNFLFPFITIYFIFHVIPFGRCPPSCLR